MSRPIIHQNETWPIQLLCQGWDGNGGGHGGSGSSAGQERWCHISNLERTRTGFDHIGKIKRNASPFFFFFKVKSAIKEAQKYSCIKD